MYLNVQPCSLSKAVMDFLGAKRRHCCDVTGASGIIDRRRRRHSLPAEASPPFSLLRSGNVDQPHTRSQYTEVLFWAAILIPLPCKHFPETSRRKYHLQILFYYRRYYGSQNDGFTYVYPSLSLTRVRELQIVCSSK